MVLVTRHNVQNIFTQQRETAKITGHKQLVHYSCVVMMSVHIFTEELFNLQLITLMQLLGGGVQDSQNK